MNDKLTTEFVKKRIVHTTETQYTFSTDDIEAAIERMLHRQLGKGEVDFKWDIGQWVSLRVTIKHEEVIQEE